VDQPGREVTAREHENEEREERERKDSGGLCLEVTSQPHETHSRPPTAPLLELLPAFSTRPRSTLKLVVRHTNSKLQLPPLVLSPTASKMGACATKMKEVGGGLDKEAIEIGVKSRKVEIASLTKTLAEQWTQTIAAGNVLDVSPAEVLPVKEAGTKMKLHLDATSTQKEIQTTALYAVTNTIYRDRVVKEIWNDLAAGMKARKMPAPLIEHGEKAANPAINAALDKHVAMMQDNILHDKPLATEEDAQAVQTYAAKHAQLNAAPVQKPPVDSKPVDQKEVVLQEKDAAGVPIDQNRGQFEQNQAIRA
jgi:hypothetical protein